MSIIINDEILALIPRISKAEYRKLKESIVTKEYTAQITTDKYGVLLAGINEYNICVKDGIEFKTTVMDIDNHNEATEWVIKQQLKRTDLSLYTQGVLLIKLEKTVRERLNLNTRKCLLVDAEGNIYEKPVTDTTKQGTNEQLCKLAKISHGTLSQIKTIEEFASPLQKQELLRGVKSIGKVFRDTKLKLTSYESSSISTKVKEPTKPVEVLSDNKIQATALSVKYADKIEHDLYDTTKEIEYTVDDMQEELNELVDYLSRNIINCLNMRGSILTKSNTSIIDGVLNKAVTSINSIREEFLNGK